MQSRMEFFYNLTNHVYRYQVCWTGWPHHNQGLLALIDHCRLSNIYSHSVIIWHPSFRSWQQISNKTYHGLQRHWVGGLCYTWGLVDFKTFEGQTPDAANLWIGNSKSITSLHHGIIIKHKLYHCLICYEDYYENLYCQIRGIKRFHLFPPIAYPFLEGMFPTFCQDILIIPV